MVHILFESAGGQLDPSLVREKILYIGATTVIKKLIRGRKVMCTHNTCSDHEENTRNLMLPTTRITVRSPRKILYQYFAIDSFSVDIP
jgi:hypothetical protein